MKSDRRRNASTQDRAVDEYLRGSADEQARVRVERELLDDAGLFERVQLDDLLRAGLAKAELIEPDESVRTERRWPIRAWALASAAALAVALGLGVQQQRLQERLDQLLQPTAGVAVITLHDERSLWAHDDALTARMGGPLLIEVDVSAHAGAEFSVLFETGRQSMRVEAVAADPRGYLTLYLPNSGELRKLIVFDEEDRIVRELILTHSNSGAD